MRGQAAPWQGQLDGSGGGERCELENGLQARHRVDSRRLIQEAWWALEGCPASTQSARPPLSQDATSSSYTVQHLGAFRPLHYYEGLSEAISEAIVRGSRDVLDGPSPTPQPGRELWPYTAGPCTGAVTAPDCHSRLPQNPQHFAPGRALTSPREPVQKQQPKDASATYQLTRAPTEGPPLQALHPAPHRLHELQQALERALLEKNEALAREISTRRENLSLRQQHGNVDMEQMLREEQKTRQHIQALEEAERMKEHRTEAQIAALVQHLNEVLFRLRAAEEREEAQHRSLEASAAELAALTKATQALTLQLREVEAELEAGQRNFAVVTEMWQRLEEENGRLQQMVEEKDRHTEELLRTIREGEAVRRALHIAVQELKGKVRVVCRMRPLLPGESRTGAHIGEYVFPDRLGEGRMLEVVQTDPPKRLMFEFDRAFEPNVPQAEVYEEIAPLVQCALDGYYVCIFAYGQTGSGKTFTMEGTAAEGENGEGRGVIPRAMAQVFDTAERLRCQGWTHRVVCQYLQLYNELVHDLLQPSADYHEAVLRPGAQSRHEIKHDASGKTVVTGLTELPVGSAEELHAILATAAGRRAVGATQCNEASSRAHTILMLKIAAYNETTGQRTHGVLNLIDLAGSERLRASGSTGEALRETQCINRSLSCLGDVIAAMVEKRDHVPFRNSKLTHLLKDYLSGDAKVLMFVNVSPADEHGPESVCSLRFAQKVNACEVGLARSHAR
eukprot:GGOE01014855.1.p1 GENE.GGOE01014855.1~~GGOE01014855.1.p1  ORF type:complete len:756 (-),score=170.95 GGOE01014855.1:123-2324(-)